MIVGLVLEVVGEGICVNVVCFGIIDIEIYVFGGLLDWVEKL